MSKIKVGVIGCGYWGPKLARNFHESPEMELAYVSDFRDDRLAHMQQLYPAVRVTRDYHALLASDVDASSDCNASVDALSIGDRRLARRKTHSGRKAISRQRSRSD